MLQMRNVGLDYTERGKAVHVLRRVNLSLPHTGLVLVTGPSGSGKTALMRLLAGLERPSRGEVYVDGGSIARKEGSAAEAWLRRVGIVAEGNLLPDRNVLENAALSARMAGQKDDLGEDRCIALMDYFSMGGLETRSPEELSGEELRVAALACALARDPDALLADEPAAGLGDNMARDVLSLLQKESTRRLVIAFSQNMDLFRGTEDMTLVLEEGELADVRGDPGTATAAPVSGSLPAAGSLREALGGLTNRRNRVGTRLISVFCAVLAVCLSLAALEGQRLQGLALQSRTLAAYPVVLTRESLASGDLEALANYMEAEMDLRSATLQRSYAITPRIYSLNAAGEVRQVNPEQRTGTDLWTEMPAGEELQHNRYSLVAGRWPTSYDEAAVLLDSQGSLDRACREALGLSADDAAAGLNYTDLLRLSFRVVLPTGEYAQSADGTWSYMANDAGYMSNMVRSSLPLKVVGVLRPVTRGAGDTGVGGALYMSELSGWVTESILNSQLVTKQMSDPAIDVLTNRPFDATAHATDPEAQRAALGRHIRALQPGGQAALYNRITGETVEESGAQDGLLQKLDAMTAEEIQNLYRELIENGVSPTSLEDNLRAFGVLDAETVTGLRLYASTFTYRGTLTELLAGYPERVTYIDTAAGVVSAGAALMAGDNWLRPVCTVLFALLGALGVALAAALPLLARRRETAVVRVLGMPGRGAGAILLWESFIIALLGSTVGALLAVALARLVGPFLGGAAWNLPWTQAALVVLGAVISAMCAARIAVGPMLSGTPGEALRKA